jgi:hypothetical protein
MNIYTESTDSSVESDNDVELVLSIYRGFVSEVDADGIWSTTRETIDSVSSDMNDELSDETPPGITICRKRQAAAHALI